MLLRNNQQAQSVIHSHIAMDTISPYVHIMLIVQVSQTPLSKIIFLVLFQEADILDDNHVASSLMEVFNDSENSPVNIPRK